MKQNSDFENEINSSDDKKLEEDPQKDMIEKFIFKKSYTQKHESKSKIDGLVLEVQVHICKDLYWLRNLKPRYCISFKIELLFKILTIL